MYCKIRLLCVLVLIFINAAFARAQNSSGKTVAGEYMLEGVMETAAGFRIKSDHTFEYGFTYGAADKSGKGTWKLTGNTIILNSAKARPATDFILKSAANTNKKGITIKITDEKGGAYPYIKCWLSDVSGQEATTDNLGEVHFENTGSGMLELYHPIFSTRVTTLKLDLKQNDLIIFPAYDLSEVFLKI